MLLEREHFPRWLSDMKVWERRDHRKIRQYGPISPITPYLDLPQMHYEQK